jgi:hypothetical protein
MLVKLIHSMLIYSAEKHSFVLWCDGDLQMHFAGCWKWYSVKWRQYKLIFTNMQLAKNVQVRKADLQRHRAMVGHRR